MSGGPTREKNLCHDDGLSVRRFLARIASGRLRAADDMAKIVLFFASSGGVVT